MRYYPERECQIVLIERYPKDEANRRIIKLDTDPCHIYHYGTCHESVDGQKIKFNAVCLGRKFTMEWQYKLWLSNSSDAPGLLNDFEIDLSGPDPSMTRKISDRCSCEFPAIHPYKHVTGGKSGIEPARFTYLMAADQGCATPYRAVVKHDGFNQGGRDVWHAHGVVGEPCFIPRLGRSSGSVGAEDDGWVLVQGYNHEKHTTDYVILDAQKLSAGPLCTLHLPFIPYGFHGTFTPNVFVTPEAHVSNPRKNRGKQIKSKL